MDNKHHGLVCVVSLVGFVAY